MSGRVVAIDGPAASGKSTTARRVAERLEFRHLNSGLLYRAIAWAAMRGGWGEEDPDLAERVQALELDLVAGRPGLGVRVDGRDPGRELHGQAVSARVSAVAARRPVRDRVLDILREARGRFDLVCDGRDIGTVVFPDAELKVFLVASPEERARRRLRDHGLEADPEAVEEEAARLRARDRADAGRALAPLRRADDAIEIDTTRLGPDEVVERILGLARRRGLRCAGEGGAAGDRAGRQVDEGSPDA